jgi:hypothetical protein
VINGRPHWIECCDVGKKTIHCIGPNGGILKICEARSRQRNIRGDFGLAKISWEEQIIGWYESRVPAKLDGKTEPTGSNVAQFQGVILSELALHAK